MERRWKVLAVVPAAVFLAAFDLFIVDVARGALSAERSVPSSRASPGA
jgi:hypothetical protein